MANLAIKGHPTRGEEVIELLEMLGGKNERRFNGENNCLWHFINGRSEISIFTHVFDLDDFIFYTLEEFFEKFPYKVGDRVKSVDDNEKIYTIISMRWQGEKVQYDAYGYNTQSNLYLYSAEKLQSYTEHKEKNMEETIKIDIPKGYEFAGVDDNAQQVVFTQIQPEYPKTYEECCKALMGKTNFQDFELVLTKLSTTLYEENSISPVPPHISTINALYKLLICRDAYWQIAGEQIGLGKPWNQDYDDRCFIIANNNGNIHTYEYHGSNNVVFVFPTKEMRDAFYENFKELIEECKELL